MTATRAAAAIHVGLPRTGTTTLQTHLFAAHPQIHYLGIFKRARGRWRSRRWPECRNRTVGALMRELVLDGEREARLDRCAQRWRQIAASAPQRTVVWSWEGLAADTYERRHERARRLAAVTGAAPEAGGGTSLPAVKVLIALRHPVALIESTYFQILRRNNRSGVSGRAWHQPIDDWFAANVEGEIEPLLDYARTVDVYCRHFGRDAVEVLLYEDLESDPAGFIARICGSLGIDEAAGMRLAAERHENSTSPELIDAIRRLDGGAFGRLRARLAIARDARGKLHPVAAAAAPRLGEQARAAIAQRTRDGNRRLAESFELDLERLGYPL